MEVRHIKANLVSVNVDKLVHEGLLTRCQVPNDRRKTELLCTEKAQPSFSGAGRCRKLSLTDC